MKRLHAGVILVSLLFALNALAEAPFDPETLGHMKAVLDSCGRVNRQAASEYLLQMKAMIGPATRDSIKKAERTQAYQIAYQSVHSQLANSDPQDFAVICKAYLAGGN